MYRFHKTPFTHRIIAAKEFLSVCCCAHDAYKRRRHGNAREKQTVHGKTSCHKDKVVASRKLTIKSFTEPKVRGIKHNLITVPRRPIVITSSNEESRYTEIFFCLRNFINLVTMRSAAFPPPKFLRFGRARGRLVGPDHEALAWRKILDSEISTKVFHPPCRVSTHSVSSRKVRQGTPTK